MLAYANCLQELSQRPDCREALIQYYQNMMAEAKALGMPLSEISDPVTSMPYSTKSYVLKSLLLHPAFAGLSPSEIEALHSDYEFSVEAVR